MTVNIIDTLIFPQWIIPVEPENIVLDNHAIAVNKGKIVDILPHKDAAKYSPAEKIILSNHAVLPGFINAHAHTPMTLFRGMADDLSLMGWLENHIWPAEKKWLSETFCYDGARLAILEMLKTGTTCFNDNYFFLAGIGKAVEEAHMRACLGVCILDFPTPYGSSADDYLLKCQEIDRYYKNIPDSLISVSLAPHSPYAVSDESFEKIKDLAQKNNLVLQIHLHETQDEIDQSLKQYGKRPLQRLYERGVLSEKTQLVHLTQVLPEEIQTLAQTRSHVVHCPESNLKLASGFCPVHDLLQNGVNVALGTDGTASNNDLDMLGEMKTAALLAKAVSKNPLALNAFQALKAATLNGAKAMGLAQQTGSLLPEKQADMIAVDLSFPNTQPMFNPISQIVYAANSRQISDVWVAGKHVLKNYVCTALDEKEILAKAHEWKNKIYC